MSASRVDELLRIDGFFEEALEFIYSHAWEDEWKREMLRQQLIQSRLLAQISANTGQIPDLAPGDVVVDPEEPLQERDDPRYWVTEESIEVSNASNFKNVGWDFNADTVVLLFTDDVTFSLLPPGDKPNREFTLSSDDYSPFSVSGVDGIFADKVWYQQAPSATGTPELDILAFK